MNIAVMAPHIHGNGCTTVSSLLAAELSTKNRHVCLTHARSKSDSIYSYFGLVKDDASNNPEQLVNLIKAGGIAKKSIPDYCRNIKDNLDVFSLDSEKYKQDEDTMAQVITFLARNAPYDYIVFDVDLNCMEKKNVSAIIKEVDCVVMVLTQAIGELNRFREKKMRILKALNKKKIIVVINKFDPYYGRIKDVGDKIGVKNTKTWSVVHNNRNIAYCQNKGMTLNLTEKIMKRDADVIELDSDIKQITKAIIEIKRNASRNSVK